MSEYQVFVKVGVALAMFAAGFAAHSRDDMAGFTVLGGIALGVFGLCLL